MGIEQLKQEDDLRITWAYYPLHPETPIRGTPVAELYRGRREQGRYVADEIRAIAVELDLPLGRREMVYNSRRAQELAAWADTQEEGQRIHDALYSAYFVDNVDLYDLDVLEGLVEQTGLDSREARSALEEGRLAERIDADWRRAREQGLSGVPTMVSGDTYVLGYHPVERILRFVNHLREMRDGSGQE